MHRLQHHLHIAQTLTSPIDPFYQKRAHPLYIPFAIGIARGRHKEKKRLFVVTILKRSAILLKLMPKEKRRYTGLGIGQWLDRSTADLSVADNTTFEALAAGMNPDEYRQLQKLHTQATELCQTLTVIQTTLEKNPQTETVQTLFEEYMRISMQQPKNASEERGRLMHTEAIKMKLEAIPGSDEVIELLAQEMELEPAFHTLYQKAELILKERMIPDWPFVPAIKQKKEKKRKKK